MPAAEMTGFQTAASFAVLYAATLFVALAISPMPHL